GTRTPPTAPASPPPAAPRSRSACPSLLSVLLALLPVPRRTPGHPVVLHAGLAERVGVGGVVGGVGGLVVGGVVVGRGEGGGHWGSFEVGWGLTRRLAVPIGAARARCCRRSTGTGLRGA